jgi:hypothetical protein
MDTRLEIERIRRAKMPDDSKQLILGGNAARLLGCVLA